VTELSHDAGDDGFHEIQLSGKQLVFLFMATTVVSVVIFLCGVLVGRGVRAESLGASAATPPPSAAGPVVHAPSPPPDPPAAPAGAEKLRYPELLSGDKPASEPLKPVAESKKVEETPKPPAPAVASTAAATPAPADGPKPRAGTWAVQVVALTDRAAAAAVVQRLTGTGYPAFLVNPQPGAPVQNYKVQVGRYGDRSEADQIAGRLKKEEQFEPWIVR
jgi:cell division septation protein DedD